jgi:hypothetical protein
MADLSPFDALAEELGSAAAQIGREAALRIDAALADMRRIDAERELRFYNLERQIADRLASVKDGRDGRDGIDGAAGRDGIDGKDGRDGADGNHGPQGEKGDRGEPGARGEQGGTGEQGSTGPEGPAGPRGDKGDTGDVGQAGRDGSDGKDGAPGPQGEKGEPGEPGAHGDPGERGADGLNGKDGEPGRDGRDGVDGKAGRDGADGERGADGAPGKLPIVRAWVEGVFYEGDVAAYGGATYQAVRDTGREPPHADWILLSAAGRDGRSFGVKGTYAKGSRYSMLDVVALNGASFVALRDAPGECPGSDWQLLSMQGRAGKPGERGERGERGPEGVRGAPGAATVAIDIDLDGELTLTNGDGSTVKCDFYPLLSQIKSA